MKELKKQRKNVVTYLLLLLIASCLGIGLYFSLYNFLNVGTNPDGSVTTSLEVNLYYEIGTGAGDYSSITSSIASSSTIGGYVTFDYFVPTTASDPGIDFEVGAIGPVNPHRTQTIKYTQTIASRKYETDGLNGSYLSMKVTAYTGYELNTSKGDGDWNDTNFPKHTFNFYFSCVADDWSDHASTSLSGSGTESAPYLIQSAGDLALLANNVNNNGSTYEGKYFKQTKDIDLKQYEWVPIGNSSGRYFSGNFDGGNFKIDNVTINDWGTRYHGLFGHVCNSTISNVIITGHIEGYEKVGGIVGVAGREGTNSVNTFINCKNYANLYCHTYSAGGICGGTEGTVSYSTGTYVYEAECNFTDCYNYGDIDAHSYASGHTGGICAEGTSITNCFNYGNVTSNSDYVGGIAGSSGSLSTLIEDEGHYCINCVNYGQVSGASYVGGLVGFMETGMLNCFNYGEVNGTGSYVGGLVGYFISSHAQVRNCSSISTVTISDPANSAGLIGRVNCSDDGGAEFTACSFVGKIVVTSSTAIKNALCGSQESATWTACYASVLNNSSISLYTTYSNYSEYWGIVPGMNDGWPIQKELFHIACGAPTTHADIMSKFSGWLTV